MAADTPIENLAAVVKQRNELLRLIEAAKHDLAEMAQQVHAAQATSMGAFTILLSVSRGLVALRRSADAKVAMILTANEQNQINEIVRKTEHAVRLIDPTGDVTKHVDAARAMSAAKDGKSSIVLVKGT